MKPNYRLTNKLSFLTPALFLAVFLAQAENNAQDYPEEVGPTNFLRDHDAALAAAKKSGKPLFMLFQEVPG